ncbi:DUF4190 domain-containing protein [Melittangium boletus]|uniref:DUF4190 domain-containing protein n=1 Tax=Melittangium boletus DSM 14713 TaxID=1294270 RepID=A0A250IAG9_9BACT|nr:DUF4190 domain-containing protein [Melittangium boletus]ATB28874.1 hypothetical protein MEBOL_002323 [Melittangium boletus DSM 14713]
MNAVPLAPALAETRCPAHPEHPILGACKRCGTFFCEQDRHTLHGEDYCASCAERPELNYLEAFRLRYWGKRDTWAWLIGFSAIMRLISAPIFLRMPDGAGVLSGLVTLAGAVVCACFWLGKPFSRLGLCFLLVVELLVDAFTLGPNTLIRSAWPLLVSLAIYQDPRNRLFFQEHLPPETLQKLWHQYANNRVARLGFILGLFGLLFPPAAPVGLMCSIIGLRRVNPTANPPVGRKGQAIAGIVCGAAGLVLWTLLYFTLRY